MSTAALDLRGRIYRDRRLMQTAETAEFLRRQEVANVDTVDANGRSYRVVPTRNSILADLVALNASHG